MATNYSPSIVSRIQDKSVSVVPVGTGNAGFVSGAQWGEANKILTINSESDLISKISEPVVGINEYTFNAMVSHLSYSAGIKFIRAISDTNSTKNSVAFFDDAGASLAWYNGADQIRKLNDDKDEPSVSFVTVRLTLDAVTSYAVGDTITGDTSGASAVITGIDTTNKYVYVVTVTSGPFQVEAVDTATTNISAVDSVTQTLMFYGKYAGSRGNDIKVAFTGATDFATATYSGTSLIKDVVAEKLSITSITATELAILVLLDDVIVETFVVSTDSTALTVQGSLPLFIDKYLENNSNYIGSVSDSTLIASFDCDAVATALTGGASVQPVLADLYTAYDVLIGDRRNEIYLIADCHDLSAESEWNTLMVALQTRVEASRRHFLIGTLPKGAIDASSFAVTDIDAHVSGLNSKYVAIYDEHKQIYDKYNRIKYFIPMTGDVLGIHVKTFENFGEWEAPFGNEKGSLSGVAKLYHNLPQGGGSPVSALYRNGINNIIYKDGIGFVVWGHKTRYNPASSLVDIEAVHTLTKDLIAMGNLLDNFISKPINNGTFALIRNAIDRGYLERRANAGAYYGGTEGYLFVVDESNNTAADAQNKTLNVDFFVKPAKAIDFVILTAIITPTGTEFSEIKE